MADVVESSSEVRSAVRAVYAAFVGSGFGFASWAARIPQVRDRLHLTPASLGLVLLAAAVGALIALPLAGFVVNRIGSRRTMLAMTPLLGAALATIAVGYRVGIPPVLVGLFLFGFGNGTCEVAMNVQGANVERRLGRSIMSRFHAGFSLGTVAGALLGAAMVALHVSVTVHLLVVGVLLAVVIPLEVRRFLPDHVPVGSIPADNIPVASTGALARWREPRTVILGVCVLAFAFTEGAGNDWLNVSLIDSYHAPAVVGTLGFAVFLVAMTAGRWFGAGLLDRFGRVAVIRVLAIIAIAGVALFVLSPDIPLALVGALLWGTGASLGFPTGMSAAADDPAAAAGRVSVVASIGYLAFLGGPPLIGFLGDRITVLRALLVITVLLAAATLLANSYRSPGSPQTPSSDRGERDAYTPA